MGGFFKRSVLWLFPLLGALVACAPKASPAPASPAAPRPVSGPAPTTAASQPSEWDKVVASAKREGRVLLYTFGLTGDTGNVVTRAFEEKYGIKADAVTGIGTVLVERIRTEKAAGKYIADTLDTSGALVMGAKREGLTQPWGDLPVLTENVFRLPPQLDPEKHALQFNVTYYAIYVNTELVKPGEEPRSWKDLLDPKWKGKITIDSPVTSPAWPRTYYLLALRNQVLERDYVKKLAANSPKIVPSVRDVAPTVARGETPIGVTQSLLANPLIAKGAPIKPIVPAEGTVMMGATTISMVKGATHPNAARLFVNWLLSREGQSIYTSAEKVLTVRNDVADASPAPARVQLPKTFPSDVAAEAETDKIIASGEVADMFGLKK